MEDRQEPPSRSTLKDTIGDRLEELTKRADYWVSKLLVDKYGYFEGFLKAQYVIDCEAWLQSSTNLILQLVSPTHSLAQDCNKLMTARYVGTVDSSSVAKMAGLLKSLKEEWNLGLLGKLEFVYVAETFDQFLDHASYYHKANKKKEAAILVSAVFEDTINKLCQKHNISTAGQTVEPLIEKLVAEGVVPRVKAQRFKGHATLRNRAMHAEWESFDIRDVGSMIDSTREVVENYLDEPRASQ